MIVLNNRRILPLRNLILLYGSEFFPLKRKKKQLIFIKTNFGNGGNISISESVPAKLEEKIRVLMSRVHIRHR